MSDFVRKSDVLDLLYRIFDKYKMSTDKNTSIGKSFGTDVFEEIRNMPIAYSIEGVAHEINKLKNTDISNCDNYIDKIYGYCKQCDRAMLVDKAIEIVNGGGMSAMCECEEKFEGVE